MLDFTVALAAFVLLHLGVAGTPLRAAAVGRIGEGPYRGLFSLASLALLIWLVFAFARVRADPDNPLRQALWSPPPSLWWASYALIGLGLTLAVAGLLTPGPTTLGMEKRLADANPARGVHRITRHPFLWGVALWALGHLLVNGERYAIMLFGALGLMALAGARSIDRRGQARDPENWARFAAITSNTPFAAIAQGRNTLQLGELWWRVLAGLAATLAIAALHARLFGAAVYPPP